MSVNPKLVTVKVTIPGTDRENIEATFVNDDEVISAFESHLSKFKHESFSMRTLTPRNAWGQNGKPVDLQRKELLDKLAALDAKEKSAA